MVEGKNMKSILISIKPEYVEQIFNGSKRYEYRRRLPNDKIDKIVIYCTAPVKSVVGEVSVIKTLSNTLGKLWKQTKDFAGISKEKYFDYFSRKEIANCFVLGDYVKYNQPRKLEDFGVKVAPQSWVYVKEGIYL